MAAFGEDTHVVARLRGDYDSPVTSDDLTSDQALKLREQIAVRLRWLTKLQARMQRMGFPPTDKLTIAVSAVRNTMQDLHTAAHYASCKHGVGKPGEQL